MNHLLKLLKKIIVKDLQRHEGIILSSENGSIRVSTRKGLKTFTEGSIKYKSGEKITYDDTLGVIGRKRTSASSKLFRV